MASQRAIKLAVLDDYASSSGTYFEPLKKAQIISDISYFPDTMDTKTGDGLRQAIERLQPFQAISSMRERTAFPAELITALPNLKLLMNSSARNRSIDLAAAQNHGVTVTGTDGRYVPGDAPPEFDNTTQHTWSLILALASRIPEDNFALRQNPSIWQTGFMTSLAGKTLGVVGLGKLGGRTARTAVLGFGMKVIAWSENLTQQKADDLAAGFGLSAGDFKVVSKSELFASSDVVSLHLVMSDRSRNTVSTKELQAMKKTAFLVNTARAALVDEQALWDVLAAGKIAGAASDVWWKEPLASDSRWRRTNFFGIEDRSRLIMSPHMGYVEDDVMNSWYREQSEILEAWINGKSLSDRLLKSS